MLLLWTSHQKYFHYESVCNTLGVCAIFNTQLQNVTMLFNRKIENTIGYIKHYNFKFDGILVKPQQNPEAVQMNMYLLYIIGEQVI